MAAVFTIIMMTASTGNIMGLFDFFKGKKPPMLKTSGSYDVSILEESSCAQMSVSMANLMSAYSTRL